MRPWLLAVLLCTSTIARSEPSQVAAARAAPKKLTFAGDHARLSESARATLRSVVSTMLTKRAVRVSIIGHGDPYLAKRRADVVKWFLIDAGVQIDRIATDVAGGAGAPIELTLQDAAEHREPTPPAVPVTHSEPAVRVERAAAGVGIDVRAEPAVAVKPARSEDITSVGAVFDDVHTHARVGADLEQQMAAARAAQVTIGPPDSAIRESVSVTLSGPALAVRPLEVSIAQVSVVRAGEEREPLGRISYRLADASGNGAAARAQIRAERTVTTKASPPPKPKPRRRPRRR